MALLPSVRGLLFATSGVFEIILLLLLKQRIKNKIRFAHFFIFVMVTVGLMIGPLIGAIANFGPTEAIKQRYPAYGYVAELLEDVSETTVAEETKKEIRKQVMETFNRVAARKVDLYQLEQTIYRKYNDKWKSLRAS
jgi:hypothetical protein